MPMIAIILLLAFIRIVFAAVNCEKELNYHDVYGYGTDISCEGIAENNEKLLKDISVYKEIRLDIKNSNLSNISKNIFLNVQNIRYLSIKNSPVNFNNSETILDTLNQLEHLNIQDTVLSKVNVSTFQRLTKLKALTLVNNSLTAIIPSTLKHYNYNLETLKLSNNKIRDMGSIPLCELPNLKTLRLDRNFITTLKNYSFGCYKSRMDFKLKIAELTSKLVNIDLSYNNVRELGSLAKLTKLRYINFQYNNIKKIDNQLFKTLNDLKEINFKENELKILDNPIFDNLHHLESINFENNKLVKVKIQNLPNLKYLNLSKNKLTCNSITNLSTLVVIRHLLLNGNNLVGFCNDVFKNLSLLNNLNLSSNKLKFRESSFNNLLKLKQLSLSDNSLDFIPDHLFKNLTNLEQLDLSKNYLKFVNRAIFSNLTNLLLLNMSYNQLQFLDYNTLKPLENLKVLDIAGNKLQNFHYDLTISLLPSIRVINLKSNLITCYNLYKIITFLKARKINFTVHENFEYDKENVAGVYCQETLNNFQTSTNGTALMWSLLILSFIFMCTTGYKMVIYCKRRSYTRTLDEIELMNH